VTHDENALAFAHALSANVDPPVAAEQIAEQVSARLGSAPDLLVLFVSGGLVQSASRLVSDIRRRLGPRVLLCTSVNGVIAGEIELERRPAVAALAARLPGVDAVPLRHEDVMAVIDAGHEALSTRSGRPLAGTFLVADPFSVPLNGMLPALSEAHARVHTGSRAGSADDAPPVLFGGMASAAEKPGGNILIIDDEVDHQGAVGVSLFGDLRCDMAVSQGCRPVGDNRTVTRSKGNLILELDSRPALDVVKEIVSELPEEDRSLLSGGLFLGLVVNEHKARLGRGDYLIRNVVGADEGSNAVAVGDIIPEGRTVRLHLRDSTTATEDLEFLLNAQQLYDRPAGALLITCTGRGERFFGKQNHDAVAVQRAFLPLLSGAEAAKAGEPIAPHERLVPLAGFFAAGEIGPIGPHSFLHGFTSCLACFRRRSEEPASE